MPGFSELLLPIPTTRADLQSLADTLNASKHTNLDLAAPLDPDDLNSGASTPQIHNNTTAGTPLLTASSFVVGTTNGTYSGYACIEMDDAVAAAACAQYDTSFGSVRNISDPAQNAELPSDIQSAWGSAVYSAYGLYTSYNGALVTAALLTDS